MEHAADERAPDYTIDVPDQVWQTMRGHWPQTRSVTLHWRQGRKRFSAAVSSWDVQAGETPEDVIAGFYQHRIVAMEASVGQDIEWMIRLWDSEDRKLAEGRWQYLMDPTLNAEESIAGLLHNTVRMLKYQQSMLLELSQALVGNQERVAGMFEIAEKTLHRGLEMQTEVLTFWGDMRQEEATAAFRQEALRDLLSFASEHSDLIVDLFTGDGGRHADTLSQLPPDLVPFSALVLAGDRLQVERYLGALDPAEARLMRSRLKESAAGRTVLDALRKLIPSD